MREYFALKAKLLSIWHLTSVDGDGDGDGDGNGKRKPGMRSRDKISILNIVCVYTCV